MFVWLLATYLLAAIFPTKVSSYVTCKRGDYDEFRCYDNSNEEAYCCDPNRDGIEQCCYENNDSSAVVIVAAVCIPILVLVIACSCCTCNRGDGQASTESSPRQQRRPARSRHVHTIEEPKFVAAPPAYENVIADDTFFGQSSFQQETPVAESSFSMPPPYFSTYETTMAPASDLNISVSTDLNINVSTDRDVNGATEFNINVAPATGNM